MSTYSEMRREEAVQYIALRKKIEALGDTDLMRLLEHHDFLEMGSCEAREIRAEWATLGRRFLPVERVGTCGCDVCAIGRSLAYAAEQLADKGDA